MSEHTPLPWRFDKAVPSIGFEIVGDDGSLVYNYEFDAPEGVPNHVIEKENKRVWDDAHLMLEACNSHYHLQQDRDELLAALRECYESLHDRVHSHRAVAALEQARALIAKHEKGSR